MRQCMEVVVLIRTGLYKRDVIMGLPIWRHANDVRTTIQPYNHTYIHSKIHTYRYIHIYLETLRQRLWGAPSGYIIGSTQLSHYYGTYVTRAPLYIVYIYIVHSSGRMSKLWLSMQRALVQVIFDSVQNHAEASAKETRTSESSSSIRISRREERWAADCWAVVFTTKAR